MTSVKDSIRLWPRRGSEFERYKYWVKQVSEAADRAARGDLESRVLGCHTGDDLEFFVHRFNLLLDITDAFVREGHASLTAASEERFHRKVIVRGLPGTFRDAAVLINKSTDTMLRSCRKIAEAEQERLRTADMFENTIESVIQVVASSATQLQATAGNMSTSAFNTKTQTDTVAGAAHSIANNVQSVAAATEQLHASANEIGRQVENSVEMTQSAVREVRSADQTMAALRDASLRINQVVKLISDIAKQSNLLALNATIEAARMGVQGRGFAVVAAEVKNLAHQTAAATKQVAEMVASIQAAAQGGFDAIDRVGRSISGLERSTDNIAKSLGEQRQANADISRNVSQAAAGTEEVSASVHTVAAANSETSESAKAVHQTATEVSRQAETLHAASLKLLETIRGKPDEDKPADAAGEPG